MTAPRRPLISWVPATLVDAWYESSGARTLVLDAPGLGPVMAGQHIDLRLTAEDGYTVERSYSLASAPEDPRLHLLVERLPGGEVSPYLTGELRHGDVLELRGPIGGYFVWSAVLDRETGSHDGRRPVQLVAGGAGVAPFLAMLDHHRRSRSSTPVRLLYSARSLGDVLGGDFLCP